MQNKNVGILILEPKDFNPKVIVRLKKMSKFLFLGLDDIKNFGDIQVIFIRLHHYIDEDFIQKFPNLKYILSPTTGVTHINPEVAQNASINIITLKDHTSKLDKITSTPELAWGLFINLVRKILESHASVKSGLWDREKFKGLQIKGMTVGIIGYGRIGKQIQVYAKAFGCDVIWFDIVNVKSDSSGRTNHLIDIAENSDAIFICASYSIGDPILIDEKFLRKTKKKPYIINTARANLVDESSICHALDTKLIRGFASDVLTGEDEGQQSESPLLLRAEMNGDVLITPHIGGCTLDAMNATEEIILDLFVEEWNNNGS